MALHRCDTRRPSSRLNTIIEQKLLIALALFLYIVARVRRIIMEQIENYKIAPIGRAKDFTDKIVGDFLVLYKNNIPLIRIPYNAKYTIEDLRLETTRFLLTPENEKRYYEIKINKREDKKYDKITIS